MRETLLKMLATFREWISKMPRIRKIQMAILTVLVITLSIVAVVLLTRTNWVTVPGTGDATTTSHMYDWLRESGYQVRPVGGRIEVPRDRLDEVQMVLRNQGFLGVSEFDSSILDGATGFGITDSHARLLSERQRGEDLRTILMQNDRIQNALVIVNFGERSVFRTALNVNKPTATAMLQIRNNGKLSHSEVQVIANILKNGIPGIEFDDITIADQDYTVYNIGEEETPDIHELFAQREVLEKRLANNFMEGTYQLLSPNFGLSNVRIQATVRLNFDQIAVEKVEYFPPVPGELGGIVRSSEELRERTRRILEAEGIPGTDSNNMGMGSPEYPWGTMEDLDMYMRALDIMNYEINQTITDIQQQEYVIEHLSIAVNINRNTEGLDEDFTAEITDLVSKGVGVPAANVAVYFLPFLHEDTSLQDAYAKMQEFERQERNRQLFNTILNAAVILLLGVMAMMLGRTIVKAVKPPPEPEPILAAVGPDGIDLLLGDDYEADDTKEYEEMELHTKSAGLEQIERFIEKDSAAVAQLLRNWLSDE